MSKTLKQEVLELLRGDYLAFMEEKVQKLVEATGQDIIPQVEAAIDVAVSRAIADRLNEVKILFPAWGDIERVVREDPRTGREKDPLRGYTDACAVSIFVGEPYIDLPEVAVPLSIIGLDVPDGVRMELIFHAAPRELAIVQYVTGAMLNKLTIVPVLQPRVCQSVEVKVQGQCETQDPKPKILIQYVWYP